MYSRAFPPGPVYPGAFAEGDEPVLLGRSRAGGDLLGAFDLLVQVDRRGLRAKHYSDDARALLEHVWALMGMPYGKIAETTARIEGVHLA